MVEKHDGDTSVECNQLQEVMFREVLAEWRRNVAPPVWSVKKQKFIPNTRCPVYKPLCTFVRKYVHGRLRSNYDLHYVNPVLSDGGSADVAFYVLKYMMKPSNRSVRLQQALRLNLPEDEYEDCWSFIRPRHFESEALGLGFSRYDRDLAKRFHRRHYEIAPEIAQHLKRGIELSKLMPGEPIPSFFSPLDGSSHPLAKYYKSNGDIFTEVDFLDFFFGNLQDADNVVIHDRDHISQQLKKESDFIEKVENVSFQQSADELDDLFDNDSDDFISLF